MPINTPPDSAAASMIGAFALIIPLVAVGLLLLASPNFREAIAQTYTRAREYFYGPDPVASPVKGSSETDPKDSSGTPDAASSHDNLDRFDRSFYAEDDDDPAP